MRLWLGLAALALLVVAAPFVLPAADVVNASWWSVLPPILAITMALVFRDVVVSLFLGVWLGTTMVAGGNPGAGFLRLIDTNVRNALTDPDKVSIIVFSLLLGGMVGVMSRGGGMHGVVRVLEPLATTPRRAQLATWLMGVAIFFDDYSNTLIVGNAMRPVSDRYRVSREKLAFLVDSTAAPVACVALVSTWIGYEVSLVGDALTQYGSSLNPFEIFLRSIPYAFYPFFALAMTLSVAAMGRDWGPMLRAEQRARAGQLMSADAQPLADYESTGLAPEEATPRQWWNAAIPVTAVIVATLVGLYVTGRQSLAAKGSAATDLSSVIGASDSFTVLLWASLIGLTVAVALVVVQRILSLRAALDAAVGGFRSMLMAFVVLTLAWALGQVCKDLDTAGFLVQWVGDSLPAASLPAAVFLVAAAVSFATGTSWGTMAILTPLAVPLTLQAGAGDARLVAATVAAILGGAVFGDHCSPISDTTIMSSMASSCDHVDHVRTQLPYALLAAITALLLGYLIEAATPTPAWVSLLLGGGAMVLWVRFVGRRPAAADGRVSDRGSDSGSVS
jgi:Na+/H+ antiporter NhaC